MLPDFKTLYKATVIILPGESHGQRSLVGYSHKDLYMTEQLTL